MRGGLWDSTLLLSVDFFLCAVFASLSCSRVLRTATVGSVFLCWDSCSRSCELTVEGEGGHQSGSASENGRGGTEEHPYNPRLASVGHSSRQWQHMNISGSSSPACQLHPCLWKQSWHTTLRHRPSQRRKMLHVKTLRFFVDRLQTWQCLDGVHRSWSGSENCVRSIRFEQYFSKTSFLLSFLNLSARSGTKSVGSSRKSSLSSSDAACSGVGVSAACAVSLIVSMITVANA